ncbi:hypothetical protein COOONC_00633 [Cooperia oncophora]
MATSFVATETSKSLSSSRSRSPGFDEDSLLSAAFCDLHFDCSSNDLRMVSRQHSSFSVLKLEDDEPLLPSKLVRPIMVSRRTSTKVVLKNRSFASSPSSMDRSGRGHPSCSNLREKIVCPTTPDDVLERVRSVCGLMPSDFDDHSISSRSDMVDSGYGKMQHEEGPKLLIVPSSPSWSKVNTVDVETGNELRGVLVDRAPINQCDSSKEGLSTPLPPTTTA